MGTRVKVFMDLLNLGHEKVTKWRVVHDRGGWGMGVGLYMIAVGGGCVVHDSSGWGWCCT